MTRIVPVLWLLVAGCSGDEPPASPEEAAPDSLPSQEARSVQAPVIPEAPAPRPGLVVGVTDSPKEEYELPVPAPEGAPRAGAWTASAVRCDLPSSLHFMGRGPGFGLLVFVALPDSGPVTGSYAVSDEHTGIPDPWTARVGMQIYPADRAYVLRAARGSVELETVDDVVSGTLGVVFVETVFRDSVGFAASFRALPLAAGDEDECLLMGLPGDTVVGRA